jgi:hypothetical protein
VPSFNYINSIETGLELTLFFGPSAVLLAKGSAGFDILGRAIHRAFACCSFGLREEELDEVEDSVEVAHSLSYRLSRTRPVS